MPDVSLTANIVKDLTSLSWEQRLQKLQDYSDNSMAFSTSFSFEDQAITHVIANKNLPIRIFTIDTGRLFEQTHDVFQKTRDAYPNISIDTFYPDTIGVQNLVKNQGINGFYESTENRHKCCNIRKVEPLGRALDGAEIWISGLRREHSRNREDLPVAEFDSERNIVKVYPLIDVSESEISDYIKDNNIPYNELHDQGFPSIGCAPCTRAVKAGEPPRSGRWWWEQDNEQECGLHLVDGKLVRSSGI
ncbi:MAG: phosphoadenylyl-sulfate reductase [Zetaproteobacteria bacterium]|nr:MAG: phosphoadenylyl-sulfate reductase [Zetaproteobacteria bacterium]